MTAWIVATPFAVLAMLYVLYAIAARSIDPYRIAEGADGRTSTSKAQFLLWTTVVVPCYGALFVANWRAGHVDDSLAMPENLLAALGISASTVVGAKALYLGGKEKPAKTQTGPRSRGGILTDDTGFPELAKIQLVAWTLLAIAIFCVRVTEQLRTAIGDPTHVAVMPDIDAALLTLMGIGHAGYFGKKALDRMS
jgi:hypothetical protein